MENNESKPDKTAYQPHGLLIKFAVAIWCGIKWNSVELTIKYFFKCLVKLIPNFSSCRENNEL